MDEWVGKTKGRREAGTDKQKGTGFLKMWGNEGQKESNGGGKMVE